MPVKRTLALFAVILGAILLYVIVARYVHDSRPDALAGLITDRDARPLGGVVFVDAHDETQTLSRYRGRMVILNLWARWCGPCVRELPALARLSTALPDSGFAVVAVDVEGDTAAQTTAFLRAHGASDLKTYRDPRLALLDVFGAQGLPYTVVIDRQGHEIAHAVGPLGWDAPAVVPYLEKLARRQDR